MRVRKMPTLFVREFRKEGGVLRTLPIVTKGCEWVGEGEGVATEKVDGSCCALINGAFYKRYDAKKGKTPPPGAIPCQSEPDPITGHWPCWVRVTDEPQDRWYKNAYYNTTWATEDGTYEAVGPHFQKNPYGLDDDFLERHGRIKIPDCPRDYEGIKWYLYHHNIEGIVWHRGNGEMCKIKRSDFNFPWPGKES